MGFLVVDCVGSSRGGRPGGDGRVRRPAVPDAVVEPGQLVGRPAYELLGGLSRGRAPHWLL